MCLWGYLCLYGLRLKVILNGEWFYFLSLPWRRGFSRVLVTLPTCLEQPLHHHTDPNPRRWTACPRFRSAARRALTGMWEWEFALLPGGISAIPLCFWKAPEFRFLGSCTLYASVLWFKATDTNGILFRCSVSFAGNLSLLTSHQWMLLGLEKGGLRY